MRITLVLSCLLLFISREMKAQDAYPDKAFKNTIRLNITPVLLTTKVESATFGYERVVGSHQSFSVNLGHLKLPDIIRTGADSPVEWKNNLRNTGFIIAGDYRFYFKRNRYQAPDGLYWGPYAAYYYMDNKSRVELKDGNNIEGSAELQTYFNMLHAGVQLGYQFVFWDRWTLDLVLIGPGMGFYGGSVILHSDVQITGDEEYVQGAFDAISSIFPALGSLLEKKELSTNGDFKFNSIGYRMVVQVGFRF